MKTVHLDNLIQAIFSCGVSFTVWEKLNADGKGSGLYDFTSLMGADKKILLEKLPTKLEGKVFKIWKVFEQPL